MVGCLNSRPGRRDRAGLIAAGAGRLWLLAAVATVGVPLAARAADDKSPAGRIVKAAGTTAGIAVHVGCGDGRLTVDLARQGDFYVHGIDPSRTMVEKARRYVRAQGLGGERIGIEQADLKSLPYADNLVNLIVVDDPARATRGGLTTDEIRRVLAPGGAAVLGAWGRDPKIIRKARPAEMDDWSHPRHGPDGNPVSGDALVAPSRQLRWLAGPMWGHHRGPAGAVTANGRLFYVLREQPLGTAIVPRFFLVARDAYNGRLLWKRPMPSVKVRYGHSAKLPPGSLVAADDRVFVVPKSGLPLEALAATTGRVMKTYTDAPSPEAVLHSDGVLVLLRRTDIHAVDARTGKLLWKYARTLTRARDVWTASPAVIGEGKVFFQQQSGKSAPVQLAAVDLKTGRRQWQRDVRSFAPQAKGALALTFYYKGLVVLRGKAVHAVSAADGKLRWQRAGGGGQMFGLRGLIWARAKPTSKNSRYGWAGLDLATGEEKSRVNVPAKLPPHINGRRILDGQCNMEVATENYIVTTTRMSLLDMRSGVFHNTMITRGPCKFLLAVPANGLLYAFPKDCGCYPNIRGLLAYSPAPLAPAKPTDSPPLDKGPAYGTT
ncbi:hypothetical protein LCGC14_1065590, partial [marine sediment metagenome]